MKIFSTLIFCLCGSSLFAQNGFFLQPEIGGGVGNALWTPTDHPLVLYRKAHERILSLNAALEVGYRSEKWEFITGLSYLRTGYVKSRIPGTILMGSTHEEHSDDAYLSASVNYNPHIILPVKVGYQLLRLSNKLTITPYIGAEVAYNLPRVFDKSVAEVNREFNYYCHRFSLFGLGQLNFEYNASKRISFITGLSAHYAFTPYLRKVQIYYGPQEHDYATLVNLGMRYNFGHKAVAETETR